MRSLGSVVLAATNKSAIYIDYENKSSPGIVLATTQPVRNDKTADTNDLDKKDRGLQKCRPCALGSNHIDQRRQEYQRACRNQGYQHPGQQPRPAAVRWFLDFLGRFGQSMPEIASARTNYRQHILQKSPISSH